MKCYRKLTLFPVLSVAQGAGVRESDDYSSWWRTSSVKWPLLLPGGGTRST